MARTLKTDVVIGGSTTQGFDSLSQKIIALGQVFNQVGGKVSEWEKESIETYKNYETYMLEAKGAMSANYQSASQLENEFNALQAKAQEWAGSTIFHTNDVAKAISEAAHAGWDYDEMLQGIPEAMLLAQAGNTDLSTGLDMLIKTINGTGIAFDDAGSFVNEWVMAANSSATTVSELGEAMEKMGATARFGDSTGELLTMLSVLANTGTVGSSAGTLLRNSMIRLIAPTKNAREAMESLGVEADEINEAIGSDSETLEGVSQLLQKAGFSAYDSNGKLKPFLTTFKDLYKSLQRMGTEEERNKVLSAIFPTRTITGAKSLLEAAAKNYDGLLDKIMSSEGYAAKVAGIQTSGLMGAEELFKSKWEEFSRKIGETLSEPLEKLYSAGGSFVDQLNGLDKETLGAIAGAATAIGTVGPGLVTIGMAMKLFSMAGPWGMGIMVGATALGAIVGYLNEMDKLSLENNFGQMSVDLGAVNESLKAMSDNVALKTKDFTDFSEAAKKAADDYKTYGQQLVENLWSKMVTGEEEITPDEQAAFNKQAEKYISALKDSIAAEANKNLAIANIIYGEQDENGEYMENAEDPMYSSLVAMITEGFNKAISEAQAKSAELRKAITSAFEDGKLTKDELKGIQDLMAEIDRLMEGFNPNDLNLRKMLLKSRSASLESMQEFSETVTASKNAALKDLDEQALDLVAEMQLLYERAVKEGSGFFDPYTNEWVEDASQVDMDAWVAQLMSDYDAKRTELGSQWDETLIRGWQNALETNINTGGLFTESEKILAGLTSGQYDVDTARRMMSYLGGDFSLMGRSIEQFIDAYGGAGGISALIESYRNLADKTKFGAKKDEYTKTADWLESVIRMYDLITGGIDNAQGMVESRSEEAEGVDAMRDALQKLYKGEVGEDYVKEIYNSLGESARETFDRQIAEANSEFNLFGVTKGNWFDWTMVDKQVSEWLGNWLINQGFAEPEEYRRAEPQTAEQATLGGIPVAQIEPYIKGQDPLESLNDQLRAQGAVEVPVEGETSALQTAIEAEDLKTLMEYVDGDASKLQIAVMSEDGKTLLEYVTGDASQLERLINSYQGKQIRLSIFGIPHFAEGGRAVEPSVFGEAGAEWAIPEKHNQRTAELLNAAREASGFTWGELLERNGGLNAGGNISVNISSYAPVINANDVSGVSDELTKDKARLSEVVRKAVKGALEDMNMKNGIEVYA